MLREEADERVDYRAAKADGRVINNHRKACDICTHETANNKDANRNRLSQNLLDKGDCRVTILIYNLNNFHKRNPIYFFFNYNHEHAIPSTEIKIL